jgi:hypothetical protein
MDDTGAKRKVLEMIMSMCDDKTLDPLKKKKEASMMPPSDPSSDDSSGLMDKRSLKTAAWMKTLSRN